MKKEEYVFHHKKDEKEAITSSNGIESNEIDSVLVTTLKTPTTQQNKQQTAASSMIAPTMDVTTVIAQRKRTNLTTIVEEDEETLREEIKDFEKTVTTTMLANDTDEYPMSNEVHLPMFNTPEKENYGGGVVESEISNEVERSDEDYDENYDDPKKKKQNYTSRQHALPSSTLLHGFISNPGYPSYYIGNERECRWRVKMPRGQKMSLTILDLHLRSMS